MSSPVLQVAPFNPRRFKSTADHYVRGRLAYPEDLVERMTQLIPLGKKDRVLDLGCGPGFLAVAFRKHVGEALGIDPEPDMLAAAERYAREHGAEVSFRQGSSYDLSPELGKFRLVTMGRSFHWMDRVATLVALDALVETGGAVALFGDRYLEVPENGWWKRVDAIFTEYKRKDPAREADPKGAGPWRSRHEPVLLDSAFRYLQRISVVRRLETPVERILDRALSLSVASPERLGSDREAFLDRIRAILAEEAPEGIVSEVVETEALLAFRPDYR